MSSLPSQFATSDALHSTTGRCIVGALWGHRTLTSPPLSPSRPEEGFSRNKPVTESLSWATYKAQRNPGADASMMRPQTGLCLTLLSLTLVSRGDAFSVGVTAPRALAHNRIALRSPASARPVLTPARRAPAALRMQEEVGDSEQSSPLNAIAKPVLWAGFAAYMFVVFASDSPCGAGATGELCGISLPTMMEAINLSINFWSPSRSQPFLPAGTRTRFSMLLQQTPCRMVQRVSTFRLKCTKPLQVCDPAGVPYYGA